MTQTRFWDAVFGVRRITLTENQRALALKQGRFMSILGPGEHSFADPRGRITFEIHDLNRPEFVSAYERALLRERPDLAERHLTIAETGVDEIGLVEREGRLFGILKPEGRSVFWTDAGPWKIERVNVGEALEVAPALQRRLERFGQMDKVIRFHVQAEQAGLLFVDGAYQRTLPAGAHMFWNVGRKVEVKIVDLRRRSLDVTGQEILTRDRVSIRVNLAAEYRVADPVTAVTEVTDFADALYRAVQYAFRKTLGAMTLDEILEKKVSVDAEAAERVRADMAEIGLQVGEIALKDVVLPGEMREILNQVVAAEKEAQANVIRRREETAATRSLLNTAKVMDENPTMLRLKELEALEAISGNVESLVVHNGPRGLLNDIVQLSERKE